MSIPKEPRQQMINMMYLVLTALLALNVSAEILKAFALVNESLEKTTSTIIDKNEIMFKQLEKKMADDPVKSKPYFEKAQLARRYCDDLYKHISALKVIIIDRGGNENGKIDDEDFQEKEEGEPKRTMGESNLEITTWAILEENAGKRGKELRKKITETREKLVALVDTAERAGIKLPLTLPTDPPSKDIGDKKNWQWSIFGLVPQAAGITLLTKFESDTKNSEADILAYLLSKIEASDFKFNVLEAKVIPNSKNVMIGDEYQAEIFVGASSSTLNPLIYIGKLDESDNLVEIYDSVPVQGTKGVYIKRPSGEGIQKYEGVIKVKGPTGEYQNFAFRQEYLSYKSMVIVSPEKMNVLYIALDNPLAISVPGIAPEDVTAGISEGSLSGGKGKYIARVTTPGEVTVSVSIKKKEGGTKAMGQVKFRVKRIPPPTPKIGGLQGGTMKAGTFKAQTGIIAELENFLFEGVRYNIVEFEMFYVAARQDGISAKTTGPLFDAKMGTFIARAKPGDLFNFSNIKARGPDGLSVKLPDITFRLN